MTTTPNLEPVAPFVDLAGIVEHHTAACEARSESFCTCPGSMDGALVDYGRTPDPEPARSLAVLAAEREAEEDEEEDDPPIPHALWEAGDTLSAAMAEFAHELNRAGARDSDNPAIRRFAAYHLADIEGNDSGAGWLASGLLADELRALLRGEG